MNLYEMFEEPKQLTLIDALRDFLPIAVNHLKLDHIPKIKLVKEIKDTRQPTFGRFVNEEKIIYVVIDRRNPVDVLRTIAHEMVHYKQGEEHRLDDDSWHTGSPIEDEANAEGGVIMRMFNQAHPKYMKTNAVQVSESVRKSALIAALASALAVGPAQADTNNYVAQAIGIARIVNSMKGYGQAGLEGEASQELNNILRTIQGHPNQSKVLPIIKKMMSTDDNGTPPTNVEDLPPLTLPGDSYR